MDMILLNENEIKELHIIFNYLFSKDSEICALGFNLYMSNYADKFKDYIKNPRELKSAYINYKEYICDYWASDLAYTLCGTKLAAAIYMVTKKEGYDIHSSRNM